MIKVKVLFYTKIRDHKKSFSGLCFRLFISFCQLLRLPGTNLEHVAIFVDIPEAGEGVYHVGPHCRSRWCKSRLYNDMLPVCGVDLGEIEYNTANIDRIQSIISTKYNIWGAILWYVLTRWLSDWKPIGNCTMKTCEVLKILGYNVNDHVLPALLWKELKENADDNNCWESWCWENYAS